MATKKLKPGGSAHETTDSDFGEAVRLFRDESLRVWNDLTVWREEIASAETRLLVCPQPEDKGTRVQRFFAQRFNEEAWVIFQAWEAGKLEMLDKKHAPTAPYDARDPRVQLVLRVVLRATEKGLQAVGAEFAGTRLTGHGRFMKATKEAIVAAARWGKTTAEWEAEMGALGISRSTANRLDKAARERSRK